MKQHTLVIKNQIIDIALMSEWLTSVFEQEGLSQKLLFKFNLSSEEAVTNIISYAYETPGMHNITLTMTTDAQYASLEIIDDGLAFNPLENPEHQQAESLQTVSIGGLGIDLIRNYMDECHYCRKNEQNVLTLSASETKSEA
jgi:anti-sigma regulatory factor (Ser/Thr protein kinase)